MVATEQPQGYKLRRSGRERYEPERYGFHIDEEHDQVIDNDGPTSYDEAISDIDSVKWLEAMKSEIDFMYQNQIWDLVDAPEGIKLIGCKWIYKRKTDTEGNIQTYKARLVAKGYR